jgi:S-DNA-T family DNA segregation ATPase FtsK/SpoIIIE
MTTIDQLRCTGPTTETDNQQQPAEAIDHLADIQEVLRRERRVRTQVVLTRLAELNPAVYEGWTFQNLSAALADYNIEPIKSGGVKVIRATDVTHALTYYDRHGNTQGDG